MLAVYKQKKKKKKKNADKRYLLIQAKKFTCILE